jgi:hypothetical protein
LRKHPWKLPRPCNIGLPTHLFSGIKPEDAFSNYGQFHFLFLPYFSL